MSKGSGRRQSQVSDEQLTNNWEAAFKIGVSEAIQDKPMAEAKAISSIETPSLSVPTSHRATG